MTVEPAYKTRLKKALNIQSPPPTPEKKYLLFWFSVILSPLLIALLAYLTYINEFSSGWVLSLTIVSLVLLLLAIWRVPKFSTRSLPIESANEFDRQKERMKLEDDLRKTFAQIFGGILFLGGLTFTYATFHLQQEGQFTDRFTKAVTQIGDCKLEVRLGGLYALERIAKDSSKDHWTVMEIISAYVREKAKKEKTAAQNNCKEPVNDNVNGSIETANADVKIATDVQTALTIIGRRESKNDSETDKIDLMETILFKANLIKANLVRVNLSKADLRQANLSEAALSGADLTETDLRGADLSRINIFEGDSLTFDQLEKSIIDNETTLPSHLDNRKTELLEISKKNLEKRNNSLKN